MQLDRMRPFTPAMELWSDGLRKARYILLPRGQKIDNSDREKWLFPVGTIFVKTFFDDGLGAAATNHPLETRFIRRTNETDFQYVAYRWNAPGTEATLASNRGETRVPVSARLGTRTWMHNIPSEQDCEGCHNEHKRRTGAGFIGFDEIRLNSTLPMASKTQLQDFFERGYFTRAMPTAVASITHQNPQYQAVMRFVYGNCVHCHNGQGLEDFRPEVFHMNSVGKPADASGVNPPPGYFRVAPNMPERSLIYVQTRGTLMNGMPLPDTLKQMPPIGVQYAPIPELENMRAWIMSGAQR